MHESTKNAMEILLMRFVGVGFEPLTDQEKDSLLTAFYCETRSIPNSFAYNAEERYRQAIRGKEKLGFALTHAEKSISTPRTVDEPVGVA